MIKYNIKTINDWLYSSNPIKKLYYNGMVRYRRFVANGQPTPPVFDGKWKATYQDGHVESAQCGSSSEIVQNEINLSNLVSVEIGDCVTSIGEWAFYNCWSLTSVTIPNSVTSIGNKAFNSCTGLTTCTIGSGVTSISMEAFYSCQSLTSITIPNSVTSIGQGAFAQCTSLTSIDIPSGVTSIGYYAFGWCSGLTSCTIGNGVTSISGAAFNGCTSLSSIIVNATTPPTLGNNVFSGSTCPIYVPCESLEAYRNAWSEYADRIQPIS